LRLVTGGGEGGGEVKHARKSRPPFSGAAEEAFEAA
jgi:hypothetical protein